MAIPCRRQDQANRDWPYLERRALSLWNSDGIALYQIVKQLRVPERWARELIERALKDGRTKRPLQLPPAKKRLGTLIRAVKGKTREDTLRR